MSEGPTKPDQGPGGILPILGAVLLAVACCAGPVLLAGGGLALVGGVLGSPWVLALGALVLGGAVVYTLRRRARARSGAAGLMTGIRDDADGSDPTASAGAEDCCPPLPGRPEQSRGEPGSARQARERDHRP